MLNGEMPNIRHVAKYVHYGTSVPARPRNVDMELLAKHNGLWLSSQGLSILRCVKTCQLAIRPPFKKSRGICCRPLFCTFQQLFRTDGTTFLLTPLLEAWRRIRVPGIILGRLVSHGWQEWTSCHVRVSWRISSTVRPKSVGLGLIASSIHVVLRSMPRCWSQHVIQMYIYVYN